MDRIPCETYYYRIASSIRKSRQEKGMTQEKLAEAAGICLKMVQKLEGGQKGFRMETIIRVSQALDIPFVCLAGMQGEEEETVFWQSASTISLFTGIWERGAGSVSQLPRQRRG